MHVPVGEFASLHATRDFVCDDGLKERAQHLVLINYEAPSQPIVALHAEAEELARNRDRLRRD